MEMQVTLSSKQSVHDWGLHTQICYQGVVRKFCDAVESASHDRESVESILRDVVISKRNIPEAHRQLLELPNLRGFNENLKLSAETKDFRRHMRRYLSLYLPDCAFEISGTNRYKMTTHEGTIISRRIIKAGEEVKYLCGIRAIMTTEEEEDLDRRGHDFSVVMTTRDKATSYLFGPASLSNHDCEANSKLTSTGRIGMKVIAIRDIGVGDEITVFYGEGYFGKNNRECLCKTCEIHCRNGWVSEDRRGFHQSVEAPLRYQYQQHERLAGSLSTPVRSSNRSLSKIASNPTPDLNVEPVSWAHRDGCFVDSGRAVTDSCLICENHRKLYGFQWPKTKLGK